jgi:hypothetical protein
MASIELAWAERGGDSQRAAVRFLDFIVDGIHLSSRMGDRVTPFGWGSKPLQLEAVDRLLGRCTPDLPSTRVALYVCPECGDLGCGAVGVVVERAGSTVVWRSFAYENNYDGMVHHEGYYDLGPFEFAESEYSGVISQLSTLLQNTGR